MNEAWKGRRRRIRYLRHGETGYFSSPWKWTISIPGCLANRSRKRGRPFQIVNYTRSENQFKSWLLIGTLERDQGRHYSSPLPSPALLFRLFSFENECEPFHIIILARVSRVIRGEKCSDKRSRTKRDAYIICADTSSSRKSPPISLRSTTAFLISRPKYARWLFTWILIQPFPEDCSGN